MKTITLFLALYILTSFTSSNSFAEGDSQTCVEYQLNFNPKSKPYLHRALLCADITQDDNTTRKLRNIHLILDSQHPDGVYHREYPVVAYRKTQYRIGAISPHSQHSQKSSIKVCSAFAMTYVDNSMVAENQYYEQSAINIEKRYQEPNMGAFDPSFLVGQLSCRQDYIK